jgi:hypothetical protein
MLARAFRSAPAVLFIGLLGAACGDRDVLTAPAGRAVPAARSSDLIAVGKQPSRLACPTNLDLSGSTVIGPEGGTFSAPGIRVDVPAGAVATTETFTVKMVGGDYVDIELTAGGAEHYTFAVPVTITLDLSHCGQLPASLRAWYIDSETQALVEDMGGELNLIDRTLRFTTPHFSGYTVAW